jgi:hypothetical protein
METVPQQHHLLLGQLHRDRRVHHDRNDPLCVAQKSLDHSIDALAHIVLFKPSLRHFHEDDARLVRRQVAGPRLVERVLDRVGADLGAFETALRVGARLAAVGIFDAEIVVLALHAGRRDELERDVVEIEEASEVEFGVRRLDLPGAHRVNAIIEAVDVLKVEQRLGEVKDTGGLALALESGREIMGSPVVRGPRV